GVLKIRAELAEVDAGNLSYRALWMVTLARCGQTSKAVRIAEDLGRRAPKSCEILVWSAGSYALCGTAATGESDKLAFASKTLQALQAALELGYKDGVALQTDPDLDLLRASDGFKEILKSLSPQGSGSKEGTSHSAT